MIQLGRGQSGILADKFLNRHGLVAGATGSGKTATLMRLAEQCAAARIPVIITDVKGDVSALTHSRVAGLPLRRWYTHSRSGAEGLSVPLSDLGPTAVGWMIEANPAQDGVLHDVFELADEDNVSLASVGDLIGYLKALCTTRPNNLPSSSLTALSRRLKAFGGSSIIGEGGTPFAAIQNAAALSILEATELSEYPRAYGAFMLWALEKMFTDMPECGDMPAPKLVFVIDEAHTLFADMNHSTLERITRVFRLIRSRGVAIFLATQNPADIPGPIMMQLGTRVLHAMRPGDSRLEPYVRTLFLAEDGSPDSLARAADLYALKPGQCYAATFQPDGQLRPMRRLDVLPPSFPFNVALPAIPFGAPRVAPADKFKAAGFRTSVQMIEDLNHLRTATKSNNLWVVLSVAIAIGVAAGLWGVYMIRFPGTPNHVGKDVVGAIIGVVFVFAFLGSAVKTYDAVKEYFHGKRRPE